MDTTTQSQKAGGRGYALRPVTEFMQEKVRGVVHLGTLSKWPLNNAPFNRGPHRIDRFTVAGYLKHVYDEFLGWMQELDGYSADRAYEALVAFLRVRMRVQREEEQLAASSVRMTAARSLADLLEAVQLWIVEDPEEGARGQTLVCAALDLAWSDVEVVPQHHPAPFDVKRRGSPPLLVAEVKQQVIDERDVVELARRAAAHGVDVALYAALAAAQSPLPAARVRRQALEKHGVLLDVVHDTEEMLGHLCVHRGIAPVEVSKRLPQQLVRRAPDAGVSAGGTKRLTALLRGIAGP